MAIKKLEEKKRRKRWFPIYASKEFNNVKIGESLALAPENLLNRHLRINLMSLTNDPKKQSVNAIFKVIETKNEGGFSELIAYEINQAHIKRLVRKGSNRIDDSINVETKDNVKYVIKPFMVTRHKTKRSILVALRKKAREYLAESFKRIESKDIFLYVISGKLQVELRAILKKIYPLAVSEIRVLRRL